MTRVAGSTALHHPVHKPNGKAELANFQKTMWKEVTGGKMTRLAKPPAGFQNATANFGITPKGLMDFSGSVSLVDGKLYASTASFGRPASWYQASASDLKKLQTLQRDLYAAANDLPAKRWSTKAPEGVENMGRLPVTPKGLMGMGTTALIGHDGSVWVERRAVVPNAKPTYAQLG